MTQEAVQGSYCSPEKEGESRRGGWTNRDDLDVSCSKTVMAFLKLSLGKRLSLRTFLRAAVVRGPVQPGDVGSCK